MLNTFEMNTATNLVTAFIPEDEYFPPVEEVPQEQHKVLKVYTATWCQPCKLLKETISKADLTHSVSILTVDIDSSMDDAKADSVRSVPTCILYLNGTEITRRAGYQTVEQLKQFVATPPKPI